MKKWLLILLLAPIALWAQEDTSDFVLVTDTAPEGGLTMPGDTGSVFISNDVDTAFRRAREYAYVGEYGKSTPILNFYIKQYPQYYDLRTFLARTKLWQKNYQAADNILYGVLEDNPKEINAYRILTLSQQYRGNHDSAVAIANKGLKIDTADPALLLHKAQSLTATREYKDGLEATSQALKNDTNNKEAKKLQTFLLNQLINDGLAVGYGLDIIDNNFDQGSSVWQNGFVQLGTFTKVGMLIARVNWSQRQNLFGAQGEVDFYPILGKKTYLFLNAGYSSSPLYPERKLGAEIFQRIGTSWEASLGMRYLFYGRQPISTFDGLDTIGQVANTIVTGSLGYYWKENYLQGRINLQYQNALVQWTSSYRLLYRHYIGGSASFIQGTILYGFLPDQRLIEFGDQLGLLSYSRQNLSLGITYQQVLDESWYLRLSLNYTRRENRRNPQTNQTSFFSIYSPFIVLGYRF